MLLALVIVLHAAPDKALAKKHFEEAKQHYNLGRFEEALTAFNEAYEAAPLPAFLFNIGQCHRKLNRCDQAVHFFKGYLREEDDPPNRVEVEGLISECEAKAKQQQAEQKRVDDTSAELEKARAAQQLAEAEKIALEKQMAEQRLLAASRPVITPQRPLHQQWWFWTAIGGGVATVAAIIVGVAAQPRIELVPPAGSLGTINLSR